MLAAWGVDQGRDVQVNQSAHLCCLEVFLRTDFLSSPSFMPFAVGSSLFFLLQLGGFRCFRTSPRFTSGIAAGPFPQGQAPAEQDRPPAGLREVALIRVRRDDGWLRVVLGF